MLPDHFHVPGSPGHGIHHGDPVLAGATTDQPTPRLSKLPNEEVQLGAAADYITAETIAFYQGLIEQAPA